MISCTHILDVPCICLGASGIMKVLLSFGFVKSFGKA